MTPTQEAAALFRLAKHVSAAERAVDLMLRIHGSTAAFEDVLAVHSVALANIASSLRCVAEDIDADHPPSPFCLAMRAKGVTILRGDAG